MEERVRCPLGVHFWQLPASGVAVRKRGPLSNSIETGIQHPARSCPGTRARHLILLIGLFSATGSIAEAGLVVIDTDATWLAKNSVPGEGWNDTFAFDTAADGGWRAAQNNDSPPCGINGCMIWWDGQFSPTEQVWLRKTFVLDGPIVSAYIQGGADDDATIWVNGNVIYDVFDGLAGPFGPIDIAPYLVPGNNLIAVFGDDNFAFGPNHQFAARLTIETAATAVAVPVMSPPVSMLAGLLLLAIGIYSLRSRVA